MNHGIWTAGQLRLIWLLVLIWLATDQIPRLKIDRLRTVLHTDAR